MAKQKLEASVDTEEKKEKGKLKKYGYEYAGQIPENKNN